MSANESHKAPQDGAEREDARRLATLLSNLPGMAYRCRNDRDWTMEFVSDGCEPLTGYKPSYFVGPGSESFNTVVHPDDRQQIWDSVQTALAQKRHFQLTYRICTADGRLKWVWEQGIGVYSGSELVALEGFIIDITDRKEAEARSRAQSERFRALFDSMHEGVALHRLLRRNGVPETYVLLDVNRRYEEILGVAREQVINRSASEVYGTREPPYLEEYSSVQETGKSIQFETYFAPMEKHFIISVAPMGDDMFATIFFDITEQKKIAERYKLVSENAADVIWLWDLAEDRCVYISPSVWQLRGFSPEEVLAQSMRQALPPHTYGAVMSELYDRIAAIESGDDTPRIRSNEIEFLRKDGTSVTTETVTQLISDERRPVRYLVGVTRDITERKQAEDALRRSEERFAKLFRSTPTVITLSDLEGDGGVIDANEAFEEATGYRREEVIGRSTRDLGMWVDPAAFDIYLARLRAEGSVRNMELQFRRKNGEVASGLVSGEWIELNGKRCVVSATVDVTEAKKAEEAMRSLVTAIEHAEEQIVVMDRSGTIQYCNPAFEKVTGYSKNEVIGQNPRAVSSGHRSHQFYEELWSTVNAGKVWRGRVTGRRKSGELYEEEATVSPITDRAGNITGFVAIERDVTERLELENQLRQAQKLESVGRLAGGVAHDFNNLLTVINGYSDLLIEAVKAGDPLRPHLTQIRNAGERAAGLTRQLLAFSRKQMIQPRPLDLNATIRESAPLLRRLIGEDVVLRAHLSESLGRVMADPDQLHQVIMNLAVNARDAMPDGGELDIATKAVQFFAGDTAAGPDAVPGRYVLMTVTDTGHGMDETTRQHIFEPFFTTKETGKGTGLGLATVYGIVRQSGGWIDLSSEVGVGTSFKIFLPCIDEGPAAEPDTEVTQAARGSETILVVEDQPAVRALARKVLEQYGYRVIEAANGEEAIDVAKQHDGQIHLLLTDVVLPKMNGKDLSEKLKVLLPKMGVLFTSGYTADVIAHRGVLDPGVAFLHKPFSPGELAAKVRETLAATESR